MTDWDIRFDVKTQSFSHRTTGGFGHAMFTPLVSDVFKVVRVSAALWHDGFWWSLHNEGGMMAFELEHGAEGKRSQHNDENLARVQRTRRPSSARQSGYLDFFVPVVVGSDVPVVLVVGPVATERPSAADIYERWRALAGREGHFAEPEFSSYVAASLTMPVLDGDRLAQFEESLSLLARLIAGAGQADEIASRADRLRVELESVRVAERAWEAVHSMLDDRAPRAWASAHRQYGLGRLGLRKIADQVLVALSASRGAASDPVDEAVRRDAFQRAAVELARKAGDAIAGRVGGHGVVFLCATSGSAPRKREKVLDLSRRAAALATRFGLELHFGASAALGSSPLAWSYQTALGAAESALVEGAKIAFAEAASVRPSHSLRDLRRQFERTAEERPDLLLARFDRYLEAVSAESGFRIDAARGHLESGFESMARPLVSSGALDEKGFRALCDVLDRSAAGARTLVELFDAYRRAATDVAAAVQKPATARRDRSLRRALDFVREHHTEPISAKSVAKVAGFAPNYFSKLFKQREKRSFASYVASLRVERAKQLLASTKLDVTRVAELSGFHSAQYFARVFRRATKTAPHEYRRAMAESQSVLTWEGKIRKRRQRKRRAS